MTTPSELPFRAVIYGRRDAPEGITIRGFSGNIDSAREEKAISFSENQDISVSFDAPPGYMFTMDGLDIVSVPGGIEDGEEMWIPPTGRNRKIMLLSGEDFPLVPGYYIMTVKGNGKIWYAPLEIHPRFLQKQDWQNMKEELTEEIRNLSFDFMKLHVHVDRKLGNALGLSSEMLLKFYILSDMSLKVFNVLTELSHTANSRITMKYHRIVRGSPRERLGKGHRLVRYNPVRGVAVSKKTTWNVAENRFVKNLIRKLEANLHEFIRELDRSCRQLERQLHKGRLFDKDSRYFMNKKAYEELLSYRKRAGELLMAIRRVEQAPWFRETKDRMPEEIPITVLMDPRYALLYRLEKHLEHPEDSVSVSSFYLLQWKRTDKLYELWCFLQFVKAFMKNGWELEKGPHVVEEDGWYKLESLSPGTVVTLSRGEEKVRLFYDTLLPSTSEETSRDNAPLYTNNKHRRPDFRMDYYNKNLYMGSLVADFKYRDIYYLWQNRERSRDLRAQFNAYHDMNTLYYKDLDEVSSRRNGRPVKEVWAVFPKETGQKADQDYSLRFISLAPGLKENEELPGLLEEYLGILKDS